MVSMAWLATATVKVMDSRNIGTLCLCVVCSLMPDLLTVAEMIIVLMLLMPVGLRFIAYRVLSVCSVLRCWELPVLDLSICILWVSNSSVSVSTFVFLTFRTRIELGTLAILGRLSMLYFLWLL